MRPTEKQLMDLRPGDRVEMLHPGAPEGTEPVTFTLWETEGGTLLTESGQIIRWCDGRFAGSVGNITRILPRPFEPKRGLVIGKPGSPSQQLVCFGGGFWLGFAPEINADVHWFTDFEARSLIENHGWKVVDDLTKEKSDE